MLLKPGSFKIKNKGDTEQLLQDCKEYVELMDKFFMATGALGNHTGGHQDCGVYRKAKSMLTLIGGREIDSLYKHVGKVEEGNSYEQAIQKIRTGITDQNNQCMARYKL